MRTHFFFLIVPILTLDEINDINGTVHAGAMNSRLYYFKGKKKVNKKPKFA